MPDYTGEPNIVDFLMEEDDNNAMEKARVLAARLRGQQFMGRAGMMGTPQMAAFGKDLAAGAEKEQLQLMPAGVGRMHYAPIMEQKRAEQAMFEDPGSADVFRTVGKRYGINFPKTANTRAMATTLKYLPQGYGADLGLEKAQVAAEARLRAAREAHGNKVTKEILGLTAAVPDYEPTPDYMQALQEGRIGPIPKKQLETVGNLNSAANAFADAVERMKILLRKHPDGVWGGSDATEMQELATELRALVMPNLNMKTLRTYDIPILNKVITDPTTITGILQSSSGYKDFERQLDAGVTFFKQRVHSLATSGGFMQPRKGGRFENFQAVRDPTASGTTGAPPPGASAADENDKKAMAWLADPANAQNPARAKVEAKLRQKGLIK